MGFKTLPSISAIRDHQPAHFRSGAAALLAKIANLNSAMQSDKTATAAQTRLSSELAWLALSELALMRLPTTRAQQRRRNGLESDKNFGGYLLSDLGV